MGKYKLIYFDGRGRAETIRLILAATDATYEDRRISYEEWPAMKPQMPTGSLPVLDIDGKTLLPGSMAICRYLAREADIAGKSNVDKAKVDALADVITDIREAVIPIVLCKDEAKKVQLVEEFKKTASTSLGNIEKKHKHNKDGKGFLHGDKPTWADLHFYACIETAKGVNADVLKPYPTLADLWKRVAALPKISAYLKKRKETPA